MTNTEKLIEALTYAAENEEEWWEVFGSREEAMTVINTALKEKPDEYEIAQVLELGEEYIDERGLLYSERSYKKYLRQLKNELKSSR